jgi:energy-coupling factor transport system substrate-specific component
MSRFTPAVAIGKRSAIALAIASFAGVVAFAWPFFASEGSGVGASTTAPILFGALLLLVLMVVFAQVADGGLDSKAIALLGVLSALGAVLRPLGAGTAGVETVFFMLVLAGRALGPGFGFSLGCTTLFASALVTGGVGPWMPYQMFGCAWVGLGAGLLPRSSGRQEIALLAAYGAASSFLYGFTLNLSFWPFALGDDTSLSFVPGDGVLTNLHRYLVFDATTSLGWDTGRAATNVVLILLTGKSALAALRRASRRANFGAPVRFEPAEPADVLATLSAGSGPGAGTA